MIYCVEDDSNIRDLMVYALTASGYEAKGFGDGPSFWEAMRDSPPRLVMLDIMLPGEDGMSLLRKLKSSPDWGDIPVIMVTARGSEYDKVLGLDSGADDYLTKPFGMMEMISRIKAVLRRSGKQQPPVVLRCGGVTLDKLRHGASAEGRELSLTLKEFDLLRLLMENPGQVFTRDQLLFAVWGMDFSGETRTVDVHIGTLRTKLGDCGAVIETVRGVGYRMEAKNAL